MFGCAIRLPCGVHHVRVPCLADPDPRDHLPDELEIHLGHDDAGARPASRNRHRHVGLRPIAEVHRTRVDSPRLRREEPLLAGEIDVAPDDIEVETGEAKPLPAGAIQIADVADGGSVTEQPQKVEVRDPDGLRLDNSADLTFDLGDELLDACRGEGGFTLLDLEERALVRLVGTSTSLRGCSR